MSYENISRNFLIVGGLFGAIAPRTAIKFDRRRIWYEDSEPHNFTIVVVRIGGIILIILGLIALFNPDFLDTIFG